MLQLHLALLMKLKLQRKLSRLESNMVTTGAQVLRLCEEVAAVAAGVAGAEHPTRAGIQCGDGSAGLVCCNVTPGNQTQQSYGVRHAPVLTTCTP